MTSEVSGNEPARLDPAVWGTPRRSSSIQRYAPPGERSETIRKPQSRTPEELAVPALITPGIDRREAFADDRIWVGTIRTDPKTWSDWHVHPGHDTYGFVTEGTVRVEFDADGNGVEAGPGGFVLIPAGAPHREGNPGDVPNAGVIFRVGEGPVLEPLDGPPASTRADTNGRAHEGPPERERGGGVI